MEESGGKIGRLLAADAFRNLMNTDLLNIAKLNAVIALLIKAHIPFDVSFTPGTRRIEPKAVLTIHINPNTTMSFSLEFDSPII